jgi:hypothetical protein
MDRLVKELRSKERGAALIIVLAFVVLLTGIAVAYLSRTTSDRQVAHSSFNQSNVDQLAQSAMDNIIGDLRREILNGSGSPSPTASPVTLFVPTSNANMVPMRNPTPTPGTTPAIPNLVQRSVRSDPALWPDPSVGPAVGSRASAVSSTNDVSANGRSVSLPRWNSHYLIPKRDTGSGDSIPIDAFADITPDWVFVAPDPTNQGQEWRKVITAPDQTVIGRYAYAIYDEGGLLDMNAAGYPSPTTILQYGRKGSLAFADLSTLPGLASATVRDNIVGWRNYASAQPDGNLDPANNGNLSFSTNAANTYYNFILSDPTNIKLTNYFTNSELAYFTNSFLRTSQAPALNNQTDQAFTARQELLKFRSGLSGGGIGFVNALQDLGTFSREALANIPQWSPAAPDLTNPNFQSLLVTSPFTRNDGTTANVGDYLVNKRFLLQRLNWLTYKGPSATRTIPTSAPSLTGCIPVSATCAPDYDMWLLTRPDVNSIRFGLTTPFLRQGTDLSIPGSNSETANIYKYFGLVWDATNQRWNYIGHPANPSATSPLATSIASFGVGGTQAATREPDFFELLQAGILSGSIADVVASYPELPTGHQQSPMLHILTIGANLIAQSRVDSYPVRIACNVGGTTMEAVGSSRLPYINSLAACPVGVTANSGGMNWLLVPNLWDPFRDTWDLTEANAGNTGNKPLSTPGYLRPPVRITIGGSTGAPSVGGSGGSGSVSLGVTSTVTQSGRVASASVVSTAITIPFSPFPTTGGLATGNVTTSGNPTVVVGRDGFLQAMRLGSSDFLTAPASFDPTTLGSSTPGWSTIARPQGDNINAPRSDQYVVFRISSSSTLPTTGYPVLILNSGFQMTMDYQSPNGTWYSYSFLQGNNATNTWITANPNPLYVATNYSTYGTPSGNPTIVNNGTTTRTLWNSATGGVAALAKAPMFGKADARSIRYNSVIGWITLPSNTAGIIGSIWPSGTSAPTMQPDANPAGYSQAKGDNAPAASAGVTSNPYDQTNGDAVRPAMMNRPFRSVGEMGYAFRDQPFRTLSFSWAPTSPNPDAALLDLFSVNDYTDSSGTRGGVVSLNSRQAPALAGVLAGTATRENTPRGTGTAPLPTPVPLAVTAATPAATRLTLSTISNPLVNRAGLADVIANLPDTTGLGPSIAKTEREAVARALGEAVQTRTWNLLIDVIAQAGRYPPNATSLQKGFVVNGEQRYWVHVAIDRFTGRVIDKQIEVVNE